MRSHRIIDIFVTQHDFCLKRDVVDKTKICGPEGWNNSQNDREACKYGLFWRRKWFFFGTLWVWENLHNRVETSAGQLDIGVQILEESSGLTVEI